MYSLVNSFTHRGVGAGWVYDLPIFVSRNEIKDDNVIKKGWKYLSTLSQISLKKSLTKQEIIMWRLEDNTKMEPEE